MIRVVSVVLASLALASPGAAQEATATVPSGRLPELGPPSLETLRPAAADVVPVTADETAAGADSTVTPASNDLADELPASTPGPAVTLEQAFELARARHPQLRAVRAELAKADAMLKQAWGALLPNASAQLSYSLADQETTVDFSAMLPPELPANMPPVVLARQQVVQAQLQIAAPLFNMTILSAIDTARIGRNLAGLGEEEATRQLLLGVAMTYYGCLMAHEMIVLQEDAFHEARARLADARVRVAAGASIAIDIARAELDVETSRLSHQAALLAYDDARQALAGLLVMDDLPEPIDEAPESQVPESPDDLVTQAQQARPDVRLSRGQVELADQQLWTAWTAFMPSVAAVWALVTELTEPVDFGDRRNKWVLQLVLSIPLYDEGRYGLLDQRRAELQEAEANADTALLDVETEVRSSYRDYESSMTSIDTAQRQVDLAEAALEVVETAHGAGAATSLDVEDAQQRVTGARINLAVQRQRSRLAAVKLMFVAGRLPGADE